MKLLTIIALWALPFGGSVAAAAPSPNAAPAVSVEDGAIVVRAPGSIRWNKADEDARRAALSVTVVASDHASTPVAGEARLVSGALRFEPLFPLPAGQRFAVAWRPQAIGGAGRAVVTIVEIPRAPTPRARVVGFGPDVPAIAANTLRLYVHFDQPMRAEAVVEHVELQDDAGRTIAEPFFVAGPELWSADGTRLTLLFDPGRVKTGLVAHDRLGRALRPGGAVRLVVRGTLPDATGRPIGQDFTRRWAVGPEARSRIAPSRWTVSAPPAGSVEPLVIALDAPVDRILLSERVRLVDTNGRPVAGHVKAAAAGDRWTLEPARPWAAGRYLVQVDPDLEDHAGNTVASRFDRPRRASGRATGPVTIELAVDLPPSAALTIPPRAASGSCRGH